MTIYGDGHVHLYDEYDPGVFFRRGLQIAESRGGPLLLLLTETPAQRYFTKLRDLARRPDTTASPFGAAALDGLVVRPTDEPQSVSVSAAGREGPELLLVAGGQRVSRDRLEVLFAGLEPEHELYASAAGERSTAELVRRGLDAGAITILPWGFGKWLGPRGRIVEELCASEQLTAEPLFFLGDTLARCWPWPTPSVFRGAARMLPGTDVLPLAGFEQRVAAYGFRIQGPFDRQRPCGSLIELLRQRLPIEIVGSRDSLPATVRNQLRYRLRGRTGS